MTKSNLSRFRRLVSRAVYTDAESGEKYVIDGDKYIDHGVVITSPAPPAHVGRQFPYDNALRQLEENVPEEHRHLIRKPHYKAPEQTQREQAYLGRNRHQLDPKRATHKHGGEGNIRRSSGVRPFRGEQALRTFRDANNRLQVVKLDLAA